MKINGPNQTNFNPYKNNIQKQTDLKKDIAQQDQLQISKQAKKLQENVKPNAERAAYVQDIKKSVESGEYQVDPEKTAKKMIAFWTKQL
ncbi:flagellar biosynthesis anti-sigma factor FlgM [Virgibacillus oceani]|uniref:Negative regulator of flagellin synthesis n=1 Tax=Virgibacillus oceani TaxID=1479511 RepID=A0A917LZF0_9BACI|nr:flagellar biosynthesis anti-sigma factor FlgM [Virgibacillus oceani]GGG67387.1 hypothetical protein GCM10011398_08920 [Virgibacillus oceani]